MFIICKQFISHWVCNSSQKHGLSCLTCNRSQKGCVGKPFDAAAGEGVARCLCVQASEEHISVVQAATHGEEIIACSTDVDDVCSGSLK